MDQLNDRTPVLIGVGQAAERPTDADYRALSPADLAAEAARRALADSGATGDLAGALDVVAAIRQFRTSGQVSGDFKANTISIGDACEQSGNFSIS